MKKVIDLDDTLVERLEDFQREYHIQTLSPVISFFITFGLNTFERISEPFVVAYTDEKTTPSRLVRLGGEYDAYLAEVSGAFSL